MMRWVLKVSAVSFLAFAAISPAARAQGVLVHSVDGAVGVGFNGEPGIDGNRHSYWDASGAYNLTGNLAAIGEYRYEPMGSTIATHETLQLLGAGVRYSLQPSKRFVPYLVAAGGYARQNQYAAGLGTVMGLNSAYFAAGGGVSLYFNQNWGIRPEVRYERALMTSSSQSFNTAVGTISFFYQFGGEERKK